MGLFSKLFRKQAWSEFQGQSNSEAILCNKAAAFAPVLVHLTVGQAATLKDVVIGAGEPLNIDNFFFEWVAVSIHVTERVAAQLLDTASAAVFSGALRQQLALTFAALQPSESEGAENVAQRTKNLIEERAPDYALFDVQPKPNERGGFDIRQSVGWRLSENVGITNPAVSVMLIESVADQVTALEQAEFPQLLVGYK